MTWHPEPQSVLIDTSEAWARPGTIWASLAFSGNHGMLSRHFWVEAICFPSGRFMTRGLVAGFIWETGVPGMIKWPVAPASAMAWSLAILIWEVLNRVSCDVLLLGVTVVVTSLLQLLAHMVISSLSFGVCCENGVWAKGVGVDSYVG